MFNTPLTIVLFLLFTVAVVVGDEVLHLCVDNMIDQSTTGSLNTLLALVQSELGEFVRSGFLLRDFGNLLVLSLETVSINNGPKFVIGHVSYCLLLGCLSLRLRRLRLRFSRFQVCPGFNLFGFRIKLGNFDIRLCFNLGLLDSLLLGRSKFVLTFLTTAFFSTIKVLGRT